MNEIEREGQEEYAEQEKEDVDDLGTFLATVEDEGGAAGAAAHWRSVVSQLRGDCNSSTRRLQS